VPLVAPAQIQEGAIIDARKGRVRITIDNGRGGLDNITAIVVQVAQDEDGANNANN